VKQIVRAGAWVCSTSETSTQRRENTEQKPGHRTASFRIWYLKALSPFPSSQVSYHRPYRTPFPVHLLPPLHPTQPHKSYNVLRRQDKPPTMRYRLPLLLLLPTSHDMHGPQRPERSVSHMLPSRFGLRFHPDHHMRHESNERNAAPGKPDACVRDGGREFAHLW
jgi:hypothetical protein